MLATMAPNRMKVAILGAALQMPFGKKPFMKDPLAAAMQGLKWWIEVCGRQKVGYQLPCALHLQDGNVPPEDMLDPVACLLAARTHKDGTGIDLSAENADQIAAWCRSNGNVVIHDMGYFDNLLAADPRERKQVGEHLLRVGRAAVMLRDRGLGTDGVTIFIGRNPDLDEDQNLEMYRLHAVPLIKALMAMGLKVLIENCPMWGWNTKTRVNNLASSPGMWIILREIAEAEGVDVSKLFITYDYSHTGLQRGKRRWSFRAMKAAGVGKMIGRFHGKNLHSNNETLALWDGGGQLVLKGDRWNGKQSDTPGKAWDCYNGRHGQVGFCEYNPDRERDGLEECWYEHQLEARTVIDGVPSEFVYILELEDTALRVKIRDEADADGPADTEAVMQAKRDHIETVVGISARYIENIDGAADMQVQALAHMKAKDITPPNKPRSEDLDLDKIREMADGYRKAAREFVERARRGEHPLPQNCAA